MTSSLQIGDIEIGEGAPLAFISGPCVIESLEQTLSHAEELKQIYEEAGAQLIFKSSYDKANRSSVNSYRGPGLEEGLRILEKVQQELGMLVTTDVHTPAEARAAADVVDMIQLPAFLCRQTDLLVASGETGKPVNVKKGQFLAPWDMKNVVEKIQSTGNRQILLTDRGSCMGYNQLVADLTSLPIMRQLGAPVCFDATHSVQQPGGLGNASGGSGIFAPLLARAAVGMGCDSIFLEAHPAPADAPCDGPVMVPFAHLPKLLSQLQEIHQLVKEPILCTTSTERFLG